MSKYSSAFKQEVIEYYGCGERSYREVGLRFGLDYSMVRRWVASHAEHGLAGLARKHSHYDAQFRLSVLEHVERWSVPSTGGRAFRHSQRR
ncbi:helix-turn-helix domain-containing protein [Rhizobium acidisoli]|uniref:helix-turn-helix domain-containing protein n=1 Tax=Rhizobium acidisoli TaxID=1538158 RepID=UPI0009E6D011